MTWIVYGAKTKKELREKLRTSPGDVHFEDPSIFEAEPFCGPADRLPVGSRFVCTNHPRRSWFAQVERLEDGSFRVR